MGRVAGWQDRRVRSLRWVVAALLLVSCAGAPAADPPPVRVGAPAEAEAQLVAHTAAALLRAAGIPAVVQHFEDAADARTALEVGAVDVVPAYTGAVWLEVLELPDPPGDPRVSVRRVAQLDAANGVRWLTPSFGAEEGPWSPPANATFAFFVAGPVQDDLRTLSQLAARLSTDPDAVLCVDPEFAARRDGLEVVLDAYAIAQVRTAPLPPEEAVAAVAAGECLAGLSVATDGQAWARGLYPLVDDLHVLPAFVVALVVPAGLPRTDPAVPAALQPFLDGVSTALLGGWNARVVAGEPIDEVAADAAAQLRGETPPQG